MLFFTIFLIAVIAAFVLLMVFKREWIMSVFGNSITSKVEQKKRIEGQIEVLRKQEKVECERVIKDFAARKEQLENDTREVMHFHPAIAPYKVGVLPLVKKFHTEKAKEVYKMLSKEFMTSYDETGSIGKRYRRQDIIGTPYCITVDDNTINEGTVTIRDRDTMEQITLKLEDVVDYISKKIKF